MSTVVNTATGVPAVNRGRPANLGTINATGQSVTFSVTRNESTPNGFDAVAIVTTGNLVATGPILEGSIDGGNTWFGIALPGANSSVPVFTTTPLAGDTAASTANCYTIASLQGLCLFRFGFTTFTSGSGAVWVAIA